MTHLATKAAQGLLTVLVLVVLVFLLVRLLPGDPARAAAGGLASPEDVDRVRQEMGLDQPLPVQVARYVQRLAVGDLGKSVRTHQPVLVEIQARIGATVVLAGSALALALVVGLALATLGARWPGSPLDLLVSTIAVLAYGSPVFWVALIAMDLFSLRWGLLPTGGQDTLAHLILPASILAFFLVGPVIQLARGALGEAMRKDFITMGRAKGLSEWRLVGLHGLRHGLLPVLAYMGTQAGLLFGGAAITETIFAWNGLGSLVVTAAVSRDYPLLQGLLLIIGVGFVMLNIGIELVYGVVDPRIRLKT